MIDIDKLRVLILLQNKEDLGQHIRFWNFITSACNQDSGEPAHPYSITRAFTAHTQDTGLKLRMHTKIYFSYFSTKTLVVGTQMNRLNEMVLLSTQNIC